MSFGRELPRSRQASVAVLVVQAGMQACSDVSVGLMMHLTSFRALELSATSRFRNKRNEVMSENG
jgi:hypothetical protein